MYQSDKDILIGIMNHRLDGVMTHSDFADFFVLFNFEGSYMYHLNQRDAELDSLDDIKRFFIERTGEIPDLSRTGEDFNPKGLRDRTIERLVLNCEEHKTMFAMVQSAYLEFENGVKHYLHECLEKVECPEVRLFIERLYLDVCEEYHEQAKLMQWHNAIGWDMPTIMVREKELYNKYKK